MKRIACIVFLTTWIGGIAAVALMTGMLPDRVATHYAASGKADGWMSHSEAAAVAIGIVAFVPAMIAASFAGIRALPTPFINLPNKHYWLAPERKADTCAWLTAAGQWLGAVMAAFLVGLHFLLLEANRKAQPMLSNLVWPMLGVVLLALVGEIGATLWKFGRKEEQPGAFLGISGSRRD